MLGFARLWPSGPMLGFARLWSFDPMLGFVRLRPYWAYCGPPIPPRNDFRGYSNGFRERAVLDTARRGASVNAPGFRLGADDSADWYSFVLNCDASDFMMDCDESGA